MQILVVGSVAYDSVETPQGRRTSQLGGSAVYFATAASFFSHVGVVGVVGEDFREADRTLLKNRGIDISGLESSPGQTFHWEGRYMQDINTAETVETHLNVFADFNPRLPGELAAAPYLFLANIDPELQHRVLDQMAARPRFVACDTMNLWIEIARPALVRLLKRVDTLLINEAEARQFTGERHLPTAAANLLKAGPRTAIVKRGEHGASLFSNEFNFAAPAYPLATVADPTGAGDSFAGGFVGYLAAANDTGEESLRRAAISGSVMASFAVEDFGLDRLLRLQPNEIENRYAEFVELTRFQPHGDGDRLPLRT